MIIDIKYLLSKPAGSIIDSELYSPSTKYIPSLDGLRAIAVLMVVFSHIGLGNIIPGGFGVTLFFYLSGFLITRLLIHEYETQNTIHLVKFYIRRFLRLYPPLLIMLAIYPIILILLNVNVKLVEILAVLFYWENYLIEYVYYNPKMSFSIYWSLAVEEHFYLIFPLLCLIFLRKKYFSSIIIALILAALAIRIYYVYTLGIQRSYGPTYSLTHCRYDSILVGCLSSVLISTKNRFYAWVIQNRFIFFISILIILFTFIYRDGAFRNTYRYTLQGLAFVAIIPPILIKQPYSFFNKQLSSKWLVYIGKLSYSIYIMHWVGISIANNIIFPEMQEPVNFGLQPLLWYAIAIPVGIGLSLISYHIIERKFIAIRQRFGSVAK